VERFELPTSCSVFIESRLIRVLLKAASNSGKLMIFMEGGIN
jgi:hypothetical protein